MSVIEGGLTVAIFVCLVRYLIGLMDRMNEEAYRV